jgi:hypothetical protein
MRRMRFEKMIEYCEKAARERNTVEERQVFSQVTVYLKELQRYRMLEIVLDISLRGLKEMNEEARERFRNDTRKKPRKPLKKRKEE